MMMMMMVVVVVFSFVVDAVVFGVVKGRVGVGAEVHVSEA